MERTAALRLARALQAPWRRPLPRILAPGYAAAAVAVALLVRGAALGWLLVQAQRHGQDLTAVLATHDGAWFATIAEHGYGGYQADRGDPSSVDWQFAFFPGYPLLVGALQRCTGWGFAAAGGVVSAAAFLASAPWVAELGALSAWLGARARGAADPAADGSGSGAADVTLPRRVGLLLVALFAGSPMSGVLSLAYSEALFCLLTVGTLVALLRQRWLLAGVLAGLAGLVRINAVVLTLTVVLCLLAHPAARRLWVAVALAPLGWLGYLAYADLQLRYHSSWFTLQSSVWHSRLDVGAETWAALVRAVQRDPGQPAVHTGVVVLLVTAVVLAGAMVAVRTPWPVAGHALATVGTAVLTGGVLASRPRLLVSAVPLLLPLALALARMPRPVRLVLLVAWTALGAWCASYVAFEWTGAL